MDGWLIVGFIVIAVCMLYTGYMARVMQEVWEKTRYEVVTLDWSEELPGPQQVAFEEMLRWQRMRQQWNDVDAEQH